MLYLCVFSGTTDVTKADFYFTIKFTLVNVSESRPNQSVLCKYIPNLCLFFPNVYLACSPDGLISCL